jgi:hypothetical protein
MSTVHLSLLTGNTVTSGRKRTAVAMDASMVAWGEATDLRQVSFKDFLEMVIVYYIFSS